MHRHMNSSWHRWSQSVTLCRQYVFGEDQGKFRVVTLFLAGPAGGCAKGAGPRLARSHVNVWVRAIEPRPSCASTWLRRETAAPSWRRAPRGCAACAASQTGRQTGGRDPCFSGGWRARDARLGEEQGIVRALTLSPVPPNAFRR